MKKYLHPKHYMYILLILAGCAVYKNYTALTKSESNGILFPKLAPTAAAGTIPGEFSVDPNGAAGYMMTIDVPPGTNDVAPELTLTYNSQQGNSPMGSGWLIDGIVSVQRVGKTIAQDGQKGGVNLNSNDRFALGGQRLVAYRDKGGKLLTTIQERNAAYGMDGTEYRTEIESWLRVYSYGNCGGGPCNFIAYSKDGSVSEFGTSSSSKNLAASGVVIEWGVTKVTDNNGNYIRVNYSSDPGNAWHYLTSIFYTANDGGNLPAQRMVEFTYQTRKDSILRYMGGQLVNINKRITSIQTYLDQDGDGKSVKSQPNLVNQYKFTYGSYSKSTNESLLTQIQQCDASGNCLTPTVVSYGRDRELSDLFIAGNYNSSLPLDPTSAGLLPGDFNADGFTDFLRQSNEGTTKTVWVYFADGKGGFNPKSYSGNETLDEISAVLLLGDYNGDGQTDFIRQAANVYSKTISLYYSDGKGSFKVQSFTASENLDFTNANLIPSDFNGDGRIDFLRQTKESYTKDFKIYYYDASSVFKASPYQGTNNLDFASAVIIPDEFNGDGIADFLVQEKLVPSNRIQIYWFDSNGSLSNTITQGSADYPLDIDHANIISGDFNGDGKSDFIRQSREGTTKSVQVYASAGEGNFSIRTISMADNMDFTSAILMSGDFNGDGLTDIFRQNNEAPTTRYQIYFSTSGTAFQRYEYAASQNVDATYANLYTGDYNGDGTTDFFIQPKLIPSAKTLQFCYSQSIASVLATSIQDGLGQYTSLTYVPLTNDSIYKKGAPVAYPLINMEGPLWVTAKHVVADKAVNPSFSYEYLYKYQDGQVDIQRGWLGFRVATVEDLQNNSLNIITRNNRFPFMGTITRQKITDSRDTSIVLGINNLSYRSADILAGAVFSVYSTENELNHYTEGTFNYTLKKIFYYDAQGKNLLRVDNLADVTDNNDDLYVFLNYRQYPENDSLWWKGFFPVAQKVCNSAAGGGNWNRWDPSLDLEWKQYGYDARMNQDTLRVFRNTSGGPDPVLNTWHTKVEAADVFGNIISESNGDSAIWRTYYDPLFHTFPIKLVSPKPDGKLGELQTTGAYDPRFGIQVQNIDENGHRDLVIPDYGLDGLGTVILSQITSPDSDSLITFSTSSFSSVPGGGMAVQTYTRNQWSQNDTSRWLWNKEYVDALGRQFQTVRKGYRKGSLLVDRIGFNSKGFTDKNYIPYYDNGKGQYQYSQNGSAFTAPVYNNYSYDRHGRPDKVFNPDPSDPSGHFLAKDIDYLLHDSRKVVYTSPHPDSNGLYVKWLLQLNVRGQTVSKSGPYDNNLKVLSETDTTRYAYDRLGNLLQITDPLGMVTSFQYNSLNDQIVQTSPETGTTLLKYKGGNIVLEQDAEKQMIRYHYDLLGRIVRKEVSDSAGTMLSKDVYEYDLPEMSNSKGKLSRVTMEGGRYEYSYNNSGTLKEQRVSIKGLDYNRDKLQDVYVTKYDYDPMGRVVKIAYPDRSEVAYAYDRYDGMLSVIKEGNDSIAFFDNYTSSGIEGSIRYQNEILSDYRYDFLSRIDSFFTGRRSFTYHGFAYEWNHANNILGIKDIRLSKFREDSDRSEAFSFDNAGRLASATGNYDFNQPVPKVTYSYSYDASGNRQTFTGKPKQGNTTSYDITYNQKKKNQIKQISYNDGSTSSYQYDRNGNIRKIQDGSACLEYHFGPENRLGSVVAQPGSIALDSFAYDASGERIIKNSGDTVTYYITPLYEVTVVKSSGSNFHTRYVGGPKGAVQARSKEGRNVVLLSAEKAEWESFWLPLGDVDVWNMTHLLNKGMVIFSTLLFILFLIWGTGNWWKVWSKTSCVRSFTWKNLKGSLSLKIFKKLFNNRVAASRWRVKWITGLFLWILFLAQLTPVHAQAPSSAGTPDPGSTLYFTYDQIGSTILTTDTAGSRSTTIVYKPFGSIAEERGRDNFRPKYTGKEWDKKISLYYFGARYYDSDHGNFISPDPAMQYSSPYVYGFDNPVSGIDPDGELFVAIAILVTAGIIGAYAGGAIANGNANPVMWDWASGKTWVGIIGGAAVGVAVAAGAMAGLAALGAVAAEATTIGGFSAGSIAFAAVDVAFLTYDAYQFALKPNVENGIFLALDLIPFIGPLIGRAAHGIRAASKTSNALTHEAQAAGRSEELLTKESREIIHEVCPLSFVGGTEILTSKGVKEIQDLEVGDEIWTYDETNGENILNPVSMVLSREADGIMLIRLKNDTIGATPEHPFYVQGKGWTEAGQLKKDDEILRNDGSSEKVISVSFKAGKVNVFNVLVTSTHTYYVSADSVLSHNPHSACLAAKGKRRPGWRKASKDKAFGAQTVKNGVNKGKVKSAVSNKMHLRTTKISIGKNGRKRIIWDIDHIIPYRYLLEAASKAKSKVTWKKMIEISNDPKNLRILTMSENVSHKYEMTGAQARKAARKLLMSHGVIF